MEVEGDRGRVVAHPKLSFAAQVQLDLAMDRRADEDGHAADLRGGRAMDVPGHDELGSGPALEEIAERVAVLGREADLVELGEADADGRMVHREDGRPVWPPELALDPVDPLRSDRAARLALDLGVQVEDPNRAAVHGVVEELAGRATPGWSENASRRFSRRSWLPGMGWTGISSGSRSSRTRSYSAGIAVEGEIAGEQNRDRRRVHLSDLGDRPLERVIESA